MKYSIKYTAQFKHDLKLAKKRGYDINELIFAVDMIASGDKPKELAEKYHDHELGGNWKGFRELHIRPDWLLIYKIVEDVLVLSLSRTGTHSDLFGK